MWSDRTPAARPLLAPALAIALAWALAGCAPTNPEKAPVVSNPQTAPVKNVTSFAAALQCMDTLLWNQGKKDIFITSAGIPDATGKISTGTKEMLISAVSRMSAMSSAFQFVDYDPTQVDVQAISDLIGIQEDFTVPSYYIRGAITQLDDNVLGDLQGAAISLPFLDLGVSRDQIVSVISVDMNLGKLATRRILPGMSANNSIVIVRSGVAADAGGRIGKAGLSFNVALNKSEGMHQAVRTLIDLSTIELLGKLTQTPYWQCLGIDQTNSTFQSEARTWFDAMPAEERVRYAQAALKALGYYEGEQTGRVDDATRDAIGRYQADGNLIANGRVDFDLYYSLLGATAGIQGTPGRIQNPVTAVESASLGTSPRAADIQVFVNSDRGPRPTYKVEETMTVRVQPTAEAYTYCYYQDASGAVARIFPNRFQPDALVPANRLVQVPPGHVKPFTIQFEAPSEAEAVGCVASSEEIGLRLPDALKGEDLTPLPVRNLKDVLAAYEGTGGRVDTTVMPIKVTK